jgi:hypothetical protein
MHGCIGDLAVHDAALAEKPLPGQVETIEEPGRSLIARIRVRFDTIQVQFGETVVKERGQGFLHVAAAPGREAKT